MSATSSAPIPALEDPAGNLAALVRTRAGTDGGEYLTWWTGDAYAQHPDADSRHLFGFVGFNVARAVDVDGGYDLLTREAAFYLDPRSRQILQQWQDPDTGRTVDVQHVFNDPVNQRFRLSMPWGPWHAPYTDLGGQIAFNMDIPISAPSVLPVADWPENSADDTYRAMELFQFFAPRAELLETDAPSVPCTLSWVRTSPWLPWMCRGQRPGGMLFHCRGGKLDSFDALPADVRDYVDEHAPEYRHPPTEWTAPNETSWTAFKKVAERGAG